MTHSLQKTILSFFVSAFMIIAFASTSQAQELTNLWQKSVADDNLPEWFTAATVRGLDYNDGKIYVPDRNAIAIRVLDPATGADVNLDTPFDLTGVGTFFGMNQLKISEDGAIFLGSIATSGTADFNFYWWTEDGGTFDGSYTFTDNTNRVGDGFAVVGSLSDNSIEIWLPEQSSDPGVIHVLTTSDNGTTWTDNPITLTGSNVAISSGAHVMPLADGGNSDFYVASNGSAPARYDSNGAFIDGSTIASSSRSGFRFFETGGVEYLASYSYRTEGNDTESPNGRIRLYDVTDPAAPVILDETDVIGNASGNSISGDVAVEFNTDGSLNLYAVDAANGFVAYTNAEPEPAPYVDVASNLFFSEYIEGSSNNKALEIYNNTDSTVTLANYQIAQSSNGNGWQYYHTFAENAEIAAGDVYVLITDQVSSELYAAEDADEVLSFPSPIHHNGDDARAIIHIDAITNDTTWLDVIGDPDNDPGNGWEVGGVADGTQNHTLLRKASVTEGNTTVLGSFGTDADDSEWIVLDQDDFSNLGAPSSEYSVTPDPLAGEYFIPQGSNGQGFASLAEAIAAVNEAGLSGATTLYIAADLTETSGISINRNDLTEDTPLTIKPAEGVTATLDVISGGGDGIAIISTDYVTIDGSNTADGDTRDLTITSSDNAVVNMVWIKETVNTTIKNTIFTFTGSGYVNGITPNESGSHSSTGWHIENNQIGTEDGTFRTGVGLWGFGENSLDGSKIIGNDIYTAHRGVTSYLDSNSSVIGNNITIVNPRADQAWYGGIYFAGSSGTTNVIGNNITGLQVNRTSTPTYSAGILLNGNADTVNVINNMVSAPDFKNVGEATGNEVFGIFLNFYGATAHNNVYHNTVLIGSSSETGVHAAFGSEEIETSQTWDFKNNIFSVAHDAENAYAFHWPMATTGLSADYNNYNVLGSSASVGYVGAGDDGAAAVTLADWQTASGQDENSTDVFVEFVSETDLRLGENSIGDHSLAGTPIAWVTMDIDGTTRSETNPYKGAFEGDEAVPNEFEDTNKPSSFSLSQNYPNPFNPTSNIKFTLPQTAEVKLEVFNMTGQRVATLVNSRMNAGEHTVQFDAGNLASGVYIYRIVAGSFVQSKKMTLIK